MLKWIAVNNEYVTRMAVAYNKVLMVGTDSSSGVQLAD